MKARCVLMAVVLGLIAPLAWGGSGPIPDAEVEAMIAAFRDRAIVGEPIGADMSNRDPVARGGPWWLDFAPQRGGQDW